MNYMVDQTDWEPFGAFPQNTRWTDLKLKLPVDTSGTRLGWVSAELGLSLDSTVCL